MNVSVIKRIEQLEHQLKPFEFKLPSVDFDLLIDSENDEEYHSAIAKTTDEAKNLIESGFEYVCSHPDLLLFRKRK